MESVQSNINRNDETIIQTLLLMGFKEVFLLTNNGDEQDYEIDFGPGLFTRMTFCKGFHDIQKSIRYWKLLIGHTNGEVITKTQYCETLSEEHIISNLISRMILQTELRSSNILKQEIERIINKI